MHTFFTFFLILSSLFFTNAAAAQNYTEYYTLINAAEEKFVNQQDSSCFDEYDQAFDRFQPFLKDAYVASQIAFHLGDTTKFLHYLDICFQFGMPLTAVNASPMLNKANRGELAAQIAKHFEKREMKVAYDQKDLDYFCLKCYQSDSIKIYMPKNDSLTQVFHENETETRAYVLEEFLAKGQFPNERVLGVTNDDRWREFHSDPAHPDIYLKMFGLPSYHNEEFGLRAKCPYNIVLHSACFYTDHKELFLRAMFNGYLHPMDLAILEETSIIWHQTNDNPLDTCGKQEIRICYNVFANNRMNPNHAIFTTTEEGLKQVEDNRKAIYLQKYSVDVLKKQLENEFGFKFFFDFKN